MRDDTAQHFTIKTGPLAGKYDGDNYDTWPGPALVGRHITSAHMESDERCVLVEADGARIFLDTDGDCCSRSWFEGVDGLENLFNAVITAAEATFLRSEQDDKQKFYSFKITTTKGYVDLPFRNSSNGYYGGGVEISREPSDHELGAAPSGEWGR